MGENVRVLLIDHHDSYTLNILISLFNTSSSLSSSRVVVLPHDHALLASAEVFQQNLLPHFDAIILGPGPGHPGNEGDFGPARRILAAVLEQRIAIPVLGVCMGHQGIALACGGRVIQADSLRHGLSSKIAIAQLQEGQIDYPSLFKNDRGCTSISRLDMIRYNSLTVEESTLPPELVVTAWSLDASCTSPPPVYNRYSPQQSVDVESFPESSQRVIMGLQHRSLPLWGVQFHPESVSSQGGEKILQQFLENCRNFWIKVLSSGSTATVREQARQRLNNWEKSTPIPPSVQRLGTPLVAYSSSAITSPLQRRKYFKVVTTTLGGSVAPSYEIASIIYERLFRAKDEGKTSAWLDSARAGDPQSRFSYMSRPSWHVSYEASQKTVRLYGCKDSGTSPLAAIDLKACAKGSTRVEVIHGLATPKTSRSNSPDSGSQRYPNGFWTWLSAIQSSLQDSTSYQSDDLCPFKTGFIGYFDYEMKDESLLKGKGHRGPAGNNHKEESELPSAWFGFCDKILAYDHEKGEWMSVYLLRLDDDEVQGGEEMLQLQKSLKENNLHIGLSKEEASTWVSQVHDTFQDTCNHNLPKDESDRSILPALTSQDSSSTYKEKVEAARGYIAKGESYELCLTNQFSGMLVEQGVDHYTLYKSLRNKNPAPYSAFLDLGGGRSILSTSPERFMSIDNDGLVEMRPIKGTLARAGYKHGEERYRDGKQKGDANMIQWCQLEDERRRKALECDPKERAENLMIVDLIRADLLSFCSPESVKVPSLMKVESYESVHQLVTTILGQKDNRVGSVEALQRCFPPGSMTGAPKARSVEILEKLEGRRRGVYSGILGWIGLDGAASTSVIIRTVAMNGRHVSVGSGGAITYLSDAEKEWQEVVDKVLSIATLA